MKTFEAEVPDDLFEKLTAGARYLKETNGGYIELIYLFWKQNALVENLVIDPRWYDWEEWTPRLTCWVELTNGQQLKAVHVGDLFESMDGELLETVARWMPFKVDAVRGIYSGRGG